MCRGDIDTTPCYQAGLLQSAALTKISTMPAGKRSLDMDTINSEDGIAVGAIGRLLQDVGVGGQNFPGGVTGHTERHNPCAECDLESWDDLDFALPPPALALDELDEPEWEPEEMLGANLGVSLRSMLDGRAQATPSKSVRCH